MKKNLILFFTAFICFSTFAQNKNKDISFYTDGMLFVKIIIQNDKVILADEEANEETVYGKDAIKLHSDGYYYFSSDSSKPTPIVFGDGFFGFYVNSENPYVDDSYWFFERCENDECYYRPNRLNPPVLEYSSSSFLKEGKISYEPKNLGKFMYPSDCVDWSMPYLNSKHKPWVEGVPGYGINEYIEIKSNIAVDQMQILNGYVDLTRFDLYKKNSRVKTFLYEDLDNNIKYDIELTDDVKFQNFQLEKPTKHIRLTIKEVYKGEKWDDTCVSSIILEY